MIDESIKKVHTIATMAYAMATALQNTVLTTEELRQTYKNQLSKQLAEMTTLSLEVKTEMERLFHLQSE